MLKNNRLVKTVYKVKGMIISSVSEEKLESFKEKYLRGLKLNNEPLFKHLKVISPEDRDHLTTIVPKWHVSANKNGFFLPGNFRSRQAILLTLKALAKEGILKDLTQDVRISTYQTYFSSDVPNLEKEFSK